MRLSFERLPFAVQVLVVVGIFGVAWLGASALVYFDEATSGNYETARAEGIEAKHMGHSRSCPYPPGRERIVWLRAYDEATWGMGIGD